MANQHNQDNMTNDGMQQERTTVTSGRAGQQPRGFRLRNLEFGVKSDKTTPPLQRRGLRKLMGASAFDSADLKPNHVEPGVLVGMLAETMTKLENKYHSGVYDAAAMPLVEQYLDEMRNMAYIQLERDELLAQRVFDLKVANQAAYDAVCKVRYEREAEVRESCEFLQNEQRVAQYRHQEARNARKAAKQKRREMRDEAKEHARLMRDLERVEKLTAKNRSRRSKDDVRVATNEAKAREAAVQAELQEAANKTRVSQEGLRSMEAVAKTQELELAGARAAAEAAELNLSRARTEVVEKDLRARQATTLAELRKSLDEARQLYDEQMQQARSEVDEFLDQAKADVDGFIAQHPEVFENEDDAADTDELPEDDETGDAASVEAGVAEESSAEISDQQNLLISGDNTSIEAADGDLTAVDAPQDAEANVSDSADADVEDQSIDDEATAAPADSETIAEASDNDDSENTITDSEKESDDNAAGTDATNGDTEDTDADSNDATDDASDDAAGDDYREWWQ